MTTVHGAAGEGSTSKTGGGTTVDSGVALDGGAAAGVAVGATWSAPLQPRTSPVPRMSATKAIGRKLLVGPMLVAMRKTADFSCSGS